MSSDETDEFGVISGRRLADIFYGRVGSPECRRRTSQEIECIADELRKRLRIETVHCPDLFTVINRMKEIFPSFRAIRVPDYELPDADACADGATGTIKVRDSVCRDLAWNNPRARMTIAHEIAHLALGHSGRRFRKHRRNQASNTMENWEEWEARRFAAAFLVPRHLATHCETVEEIQRRFGISREAAKLRAIEIEADVRKEKGIERPLPPGVADFLAEAKKKGYQVFSR